MRLAHRKCVFFKTSERFLPVIRALTSGQIYRLPPDMENPDTMKALGYTMRAFSKLSCFSPKKESTHSLGT